MSKLLEIAPDLNIDEEAEKASTVVHIMTNTNSLEVIGAENIPLVTTESEEL